MSYQKEPRSKKPAYFTTLPDTIAQSPTGITKIPNSRFPTMAPLNPATFKSVYERAGFDVYKPPSGSGRKSAPATPTTTNSGFRSASASHIPSSAKREVASNQKRNASTHFSTPHSSDKTNVPPVPKLQIDATLANKTAQPSFTTQPLTSQTPKSAATAPAAPQISVSSTGRQSLPSSQTSGYAFNKSGKLPPLSADPYSTARSSAQDSNFQQSYPQSATSSGLDTNSQKSVPQSATSSRFDVNSQRNVLSSTSTSPSKGTDRAIQPQTATSSRFDFYQQNVPQSATSSRFDVQTNSTSSSDRNDNESVYMSTQSFQNMGSNQSNGMIAPSRPSALNSRETLNNTTMMTSGPLSATTTPTSSRFGGMTPTSRSFPAPAINASHIPSQADRSIDSTIDHSVQSTGTVNYQPQSARTLTQHSDDDSDDELNLSSEDESDEESMKSAILSPNPNSRHSEAPTAQEVEQLQKDAAAAASSSLPPMPPKHMAAVPAFMVSDPEGNIMEHGNPLSPTTVAKQLESRFSTRSSMYGGEFSPDTRSVRESPSTSGGYDDIPQLKAQFASSDPIRDSYVTEDGENDESNAEAFEDVENQLETLGMNSSYGQSKSSFDFTNDKTHLYNTDYREETEPRVIEPLTIKVHSVKESTTDTESLEQKSLADQTSWTAKVPTPLATNTGVFEPETQADIPETSPLRVAAVPTPKKYAPGEGPCRKCGLEIDNKPIYSKSGELSGQWHRPCFTCTLCDTRFNKNINCFVLNDEPYCEFHYHLTNNSLCRVCGHGIVGKCLENDTNDRYHADCLKCVGCSTQIDGDYVSVNGQVHCENCAERYTAQVLSTGESKIERRRTRLYFI